MVRWLPYFIAGRYLRSRKSHSVINIISGVSVAAMATPVAAMVILLSVFNGLEGMVRTLYRAVDADITIRAAEGTVFDVAAVDMAAIRAAEGVETLSLVLEQGAMAEVGDRRTIVRLRGVERTYEDVVPVAQTIYGGTFGGRIYAADAARGGVLLDRRREWRRGIRIARRGAGYVQL